MTDRFTFNCWKCHKDYTLFREITPEQILTVACPYCGEEAVVDLDPYRRPIISVLKGIGDKESDLGQALDLPKVLPTRKPD